MSYPGYGPSGLGEGEGPLADVEPPSERPSHGAYDAMDNGLPMPESVKYE